MIHNDIKRQDGSSLENHLSRQLRDPEASRLLYQSLDNYNAFALQFYCDLLPPERTRVKRDLSLNDGSTLRLWGLNTAFVSSSKDKEGDIFVDPASLQITRHDGIVNMVVAHHHLSWLRQKRALEDHLNDVAPVQIFGHVHTNRIDMARDYVRLTASAAHPDRNERGWEPGYNLIELSVDGTGDQRWLKVRAHVRIWQTAPGGFQTKMDGDKDTFEHSIKLGTWHQTTSVFDAVMRRSEHDAALEPVDAILIEGGKAMNKLRDLGLRFYRLPFSKKSEIAGRLNLLEEGDMTQPDFERFRRVFIRAHEREMLDQLAEEIRNAEEK